MATTPDPNVWYKVHNTNDDVNGLHAGLPHDTSAALYTTEFDADTASNHFQFLADTDTSDGEYYIIRPRQLGSEWFASTTAECPTSDCMILPGVASEPFNGSARWAWQAWDESDSTSGYKLFTEELGDQYLLDLQAPDTSNGNLYLNSDIYNIPSQRWALSSIEPINDDTYSTLPFAYDSSVSATASPTTTSTQTSTASASAAANEVGGGLSTGAAAGIGVGIALAVLIAIGAVIMAIMHRKRKARQEQKYEPAATDMSDETKPPHDGLPSHKPELSATRSQRKTPSGVPVEIETSSNQPVELPGSNPQPVELSASPR